MSSHNDAKLNHLLKEWPKGTVATQVWLSSRRIYRQLTRRYLSSGWIDRLGRGAFVRSGDRVDWFGAVYALQAQLNLRVHVGGVTALRLKGLGHYIPLGKGEKVYLFSNHRKRLPNWFMQQSWDVNVACCGSILFDDLNEESFAEHNRGSFTVRISSPERAILEVMHLSTTNEDIDHALQLFQGLTTLRPSVLQNLLEKCKFVKVKRLFLWAAEHSGYQWFSRLDEKKISLGKGKRELYKGGVFDSKYQITVPREEGLPDV